MSTTPSPDRAGRVLLALAIVFAILPVLVVSVPPLCDLPNHLGRVHVLAHYDEAPQYAAFYVRDYAVLPNLALDLVAVPLAKVVSTETAGRVFVGLTLLSVVLGAAAVARARRRSAGMSAALAACFVHDVSLAYGFVNYVFGLGAMLFALAAWIGLRERHTALRVGVTSALALVVFFAHLIPLALLAVCIAGLEVARYSERAERPRDWLHFARDAGLAAVPFLVPIALYFALSPTRAELGGTWQATEIGKKLAQLASFLFVGDGARDVAYTVMLALGLCWVAWLGRPRLGRDGLAVLALLLAVFALAPEKTATADNISLRLPVAIALGFAAFFGLPRGRASGRSGLAIAVILGLLVATRGSQITAKWRDEAPTYERLSAAFARVPAGASVFTLRDEFHRRAIRESWFPPLAHAAGLALLRSPVWLPQLFANVGQQPLIVRDPDLLATRFVRSDFMPTYRTPAEFEVWLDALAAAHAARTDAFAKAPVCVLHLTLDDGASTTELPTAGLVELGRGKRWILWSLPPRR